MKTLFTLDYELFNGLDSGSVQNCLITPTNELIKVLDQFGFKATFFVDTVFLNRLFSLKDSNFSLQKDWEAIERQLKQLANNGHQLQLHIHPQWYNATFDNNRWTSILSDYKLSDMPSEAVESMFRDGISLLKMITGDAPIAFRAGAYCIQTLTDYSEILSRHGILIDSSVNREKVSKTDKYQWYDYSNVPNKYLYRFKSDVTKEDNSGQLIEVSIPSYNISMPRFYFNLVKNKLYKTGCIRWGDGTGSIGTLSERKKQIKDRITSHLNPSRVAASIDATNAVNLQWIFSKEKDNNSDYFLIMGHPKAFTPYSLKKLRAFLSKNSICLENVVISQLLTK